MSTARFEVRSKVYANEEGWMVYDKHAEKFVGGWFGKGVRIAAEQTAQHEECVWLASENERLLALEGLLSDIVASAYGETTYPGGRTTTEVKAELIDRASKALGFTKRYGVG